MRNLVISFFLGLSQAFSLECLALPSCFISGFLEIEQLRERLVRTTFRSSRSEGHLQNLFWGAVSTASAYQVRLTPVVQCSCIREEPCHIDLIRFDSMLRCFPRVPFKLDAPKSQVALLRTVPAGSKMCEGDADMVMQCISECLSMEKCSIIRYAREKSRPAKNDHNLSASGQPWRLCLVL